MHGDTRQNFSPTLSTTVHCTIRTQICTQHTLHYTNTKYQSSYTDILPVSKNTRSYEQNYSRTGPCEGGVVGWGRRPQELVMRGWAKREHTPKGVRSIDVAGWASNSGPYSRGVLSRQTSPYHSSGQPLIEPWFVVKLSHITMHSGRWRTDEGTLI